jgi:hypothetical protein
MINSPIRQTAVPWSLPLQARPRSVKASSFASSVGGPGQTFIADLENPPPPNERSRRHCVAPHHRLRSIAVVEQGRHLLVVRALCRT